MRYRIVVKNSSVAIKNPLLRLSGLEFVSRSEACDAIFCAMYETIDSQEGCEMIQRPDTSCVGDCEYIKIIDQYIDECYDYILKEGHAREDGVSAHVEEIDDNYYLEME